MPDWGKASLQENLAASRYTEIPAAARRKGVLAAMAQQQIEAKLN